MANKTIIFAAFFNVAVIICLTAGDGLATARYAKKHEISCKSCHSSGVELNPLGQRFWKNKHTFSNDDALLVEKLKQSDPYDSKSKIAEPPDGNSGRPPAVVQGITDSSAPNMITPETAPLPETRIYRRTASDGTVHFSDRPELDVVSTTGPATTKSGKKITRPGFRPLAAFTPKPYTRTTAPKRDKAVLRKPAPIILPETAKPAIDTIPKPRSFDQCMEQKLVSSPPPESPEEAVEQFREAEESCVSFKKKQP